MLTWALCVVMASQPIRVCEPYPDEIACNIALKAWDRSAIEYARKSKINILAACLYTTLTDRDRLVQPVGLPAR
jgi:hypothetical protein